MEKLIECVFFESRMNRIEVFEIPLHNVAMYEFGHMVTLRNYEIGVFFEMVGVL